MMPSFMAIPLTSRNCEVIAELFNCLSVYRLDTSISNK